MRAPLVLLIDLLLVAVFVAIGRSSHGEPLTPSGLWHTGWPFLLAALAGWQFARAWRAPLALRPGLILWAVTVIGGLLIRVSFTGETAAVPFVIVTAITLAVFLLGWRLVAGRLLARRAGAASPPLERG